LLNLGFMAFAPHLAIQPSHLVQIPIADSFDSFLGLFTLPDFSQITNPAIYTTAFTLAVVASLETLLCAEATDKLDPYNRITPASRELKAQGVGNIISGLIGGLPITQVIVRSSANIQSGGKTKASAIIHGFLILIAALIIPFVLNLIPLATLAAILFVVGFKLAKPSLFKSMWALGKYQFIPFIVTIIGILFTDLLMGIAMGMGVAVFFILLNNLRNPYFFAEETHDERGDTIHLRLSEDVSFLNRASIMKTLDKIPPHTRVVIDATKSVNIDYDVYEIIRNFERMAKTNKIDLTIHGLSLRQRNDSVKRAEEVMDAKSEMIASNETEEVN
jgi:MFS superfamily sulfate permease-like transporter